MQRMENGELIDMSPEEIAEWEATPAPRRLLRKSTVTARLIEAGLMATAHTVLLSDPIAYARWFTPDWPNVYADDEGLLAFLAGVGCTAEQIDAVTAP